MKKKPTFLCMTPIPFAASLIGGFNALYVFITGILLLILVIKVIYHLLKHHNIKEKISRNYLIFCIISIIYSLIFVYAYSYLGTHYYVQYLIFTFSISLFLALTYKTLRRYFTITLIVFAMITLAISAISYWQFQKRMNSPVVTDENDGLPYLSSTSCGGFSIF
ncbi:MAG: hypothetical protein WCV58_04420 [Patescibacteria group bacterium]